MKIHSKKPVLSIVIPAYNEGENIRQTIVEIIESMLKEKIPYELVVVNDNSKDETSNIVKECQKKYKSIKLVNRTPPGGFGRAVRTGLANVTGDYVTIVMADLSDDPSDIVKYYSILQSGYDCVFGTRFTKESIVKDYPIVKYIVNRIVNKALQIMFWSKFNDLTNAFKAFKTEIIRDIFPLRAAHFNITIEISLSLLIRQYKIASVPIHWYGRKWGQSNLKLRAMGRRYLATLAKIWFERILIIDDLLAEKSIIKPEDQE